MINVGILGIGFMGMMHYHAYQRVKGVRVSAMVSRDAKKRAGDWRGIQGNFGPPGEQMDLSAVQCYETLDALLADHKIDVVDVCLPPSMHAAAAVAAFKAGKHVFCEKPIAVSLTDAKKMVQAAEQSGKRLFVGHVLPFLPEYAHALKQVRAGKLGALLGGMFKRVIAIPTWGADYFDPIHSGGPLIDLHVHDAHLIRVLFGMPTAVQTMGRLHKETAEYATTQFMFPESRFAVTSVCGVLRQQGRSFNHAYEIHFEKGTLVFEMAVIEGKARTLMPLTLFDHKGKAQEIKLPAGDDFSGFVAEIQEVVQCLKNDKPSELLDGSLAKDALTLCGLELKSLQSGKAVKV